MHDPEGEREFWHFVEKQLKQYKQTESIDNILSAAREMQQDRQALEQLQNQLIDIRFSEMQSLKRLVHRLGSALFDGTRLELSDPKVRQAIQEAEQCLQYVEKSTTISLDDVHMLGRVVS